MIWAAFIVAVVFVVACVAGAIDASGADVAAANHEALLDELWDDGAAA